MAAPVLPKFDISDALNNTSTATGGRIDNGMIFNTSGGTIGFVKLLALAGVALLAYRLFRGQR